MQKIIAFSLLFAALPAAAVVCKTVGPDGSVTYSDIPADACPNEVRLPKSSTYQPVPVTASSSSEPNQETPDGPFAGYLSAAISQPANNSTVRSEEGRVPVSLDLQPALQEGHRVRWTLDGIQIQPPFDSPSAVLTGVDRGSHILTAHVLNEAGVVLRGTVPVRFTLRKTSILDAQDGNGEPPPPTYESGDFKAKAPPAETYDADKADENTFGSAPTGPGESPEFEGTTTPSGYYKRTPPPISTTPGQTNPAFKPNFSTQ